MPGFRYCSWCNGRGCIACDAEQRKFVEKAMKNAPKWRDGDIRDVRDATLEAEMMRRFAGMDSLSEDEIESAFKPALDAEYARQFPNGPQSAFTARLDNPADMDLLMSIAHADVLRRVFADGVTEEGLVELDRLQAEARVTQAARKVLCPTAEDQKEEEITP